jgi:hypothetical protein
VNFPVELFKKRFELAPSHLTDLDYEFYRRTGIEPTFMLTRKAGRLHRASFQQA